MGYGAIIGQTPTVQASAEMTSYNNDNTSSVITADNVQGAIDQLFTSVSNGKSQIASAITDMGVSTSANATFAQMATNIGNIETGYDTSQVTATANTVRSGYKFVNSSGQLITGTIPSKGAQTYTPKTVSQTISSGQYLSGNQTIQGDENLKGEYIKRGINIFGVSGSYTGDIKFSKCTVLHNGTQLKIDEPNFGSFVGCDFFIFWSGAYIYNDDFSDSKSMIMSISGNTDPPTGANGDQLEDNIQHVGPGGDPETAGYFWGVILEDPQPISSLWIFGGARTAENILIYKSLVDSSGYTYINLYTNYNDKERFAIGEDYYILKVPR